MCGLYAGTTQSANCFAGYNVRQSGGATVVVPFVNGAEVGTVFTVLQGHTYTLRIRLHCVEMQRVLQIYYAMVDGVVQTFGGGLVTAPMASCLSCRIWECLPIRRLRCCTTEVW